MVKNGYIYIVNKKHFTIFFKQSLLQPFVRFYDTPKGPLLKNEDFIDILMYAQSTGITTALQTKTLLKKRTCVFCFFIQKYSNVQVICRNYLVFLSLPILSDVFLLQCIQAISEYVFICSVIFVEFLRLQLTYYKI